MAAQTLLCALTAVLLAAAAIGLCVSGAEPAFTREKAGATLLPALPLLLLALVMAVAGIILGVRDEDTDAPARRGGRPGGSGGMNRFAASREESAGIRRLRAAVLVLSLLLIGLGILNGGLEDVLAKGAAVCMECIGVG